jgi:hypothetical protein
VTNAGSTYYGYAAFAGTELTSYAFQITPGVGIQAGAPITGPLQSVPEPASFALLGMGVLGLTLLRRKYHA